MALAVAPSVVDRATSAHWEGPPPAIAVLVATYGRSAYLADLLGCLAAQDLPRTDLEVIVVDNGSTDDTWAVLQELVAGTDLRAMALRIDHNRGPGPGRNAAAAEARAPIIAITDDDCLPTAAWLPNLVRAFAADPAVEVVQGAVHADPADAVAMGPWDHTKWIRRPTPFFETCNVAYRRAAFERVGGFDEDDPLLHPASGRAFGEDACLAWAVQRTGGTAAFAPDALVHHRCIPSDYRRWLADQRELAGFPGLARRSPLVASWLHRGVFLDRRSEQFDLAVAGLLAAALLRRRWPLVVSLPWVRRRWRDARRLADARHPAARVLGQLAWSDTVALAAMARGSLRHRRLVL